MMEVDLERYHVFARFNRLLLTAIGVWPKSHRIQKKISSGLVLTSTFLVMLTVSNFCFHNITNVMLLTRGMGLAVSFFATFMKVCLFLLHHEDLTYLNDVLTERFVADLKSREDAEHMLDHFKLFTRMMYPHFVFLGSTMLMYGLGPMIKLSKHGEYEHVFPQVYPIHYDEELGSPLYWLFYGLEFIGALSLALVNTGIDCIFAQYCIQIVGELRILGRRFSGLRFNKNDGEDGQLLGYRRNLKDCVTRHYLLLDSKKHMESLYGITSIYTAVSSALVLCSLMFQVTEIAKTQTSYLYIVQLCCYLFPKLLQILTYAWHGNLITIESGTCLYEMYKSAWPDTCDPHFKNDILIILTQEPLALLAKGCMFIQLDMFTKVVKASVSYFCILRTLNEAAEA